VKEVEDAGGKVKVAVFDTVVSMPGVRVPYERLVKACKEAGVLSIVDGAHGIGHLELDLEELDADFFVSNCHK
jgi:selenocysteine lyase/cysteine desulfurase